MSVYYIIYKGILMASRSFMDHISDHYNEIRSLFKSRSYTTSIQFDEDLFGDAFIKCATKFGEDEITYETAVKYFWVVYVNTVKSQFINACKFNYAPIEEASEVIDEYTSENEIYNTIMDAVKVAFNEEDMNLYRLYKYHEWNEKELIDAGFDCTNLKDKIKTIHKFVKEYSKNNYKKKQ